MGEAVGSAGLAYVTENESVDELLEYVNAYWPGERLAGVQGVYNVQPIESEESFGFSIPSEEAFSLPSLSEPARGMSRTERRPRPSDRYVLAQRCARCGTPATGADAPVWAGSNLCNWCEYQWLKYELDNFQLRHYLSYQ